MTPVSLETHPFFSSQTDNREFSSALTNKRFELMETLLTEQPDKIDPSIFNNLAIQRASYEGKTNLVNLLLKHPKVDPSACQNQSIIFASTQGHVEVVRCLLRDRRVNPADQDNEAIKQARYNYHTEVVHELLKDSRVAIPFIGRRIAAIVAMILVGKFLLSKNFPKLTTLYCWSLAITLSITLYFIISKIKKQTMLLLNK